MGPPAADALTKVIYERPPGGAVPRGGPACHSIATFGACVARKAVELVDLLVVFHSVVCSWRASPKTERHLFVSYLVETRWTLTTRRP